MRFFDFDDYKEIIRTFIRFNPIGRGYHSQLAKASGSQSSYLSQIIYGNAHLSFEQAAAMCRFWVLDEIETDFFIALVGSARAANQHLRRKFERDVVNIRIMLQTNDRLESERVFPDSDSTADSLPLHDKYYSDWMIPLIHSATRTGNWENIRSLSQKLSLSSTYVFNVLTFLEVNGLIQREKNSWKFLAAPRVQDLKPQLRLRFHDNLRQLAGIYNRDTSHKPEDGLHYFLLTATSEQAFTDMKAAMEKFLGEQTSQMEDVSPQKAVGICVDLFSL